MAGLQRHLHSLIRRVGKRVDHHASTVSAAGFSSSSSSSFSSASHFQSLRRPSSRTISRPLYHYFQHLGISSSRNLLADSSDGAPLQSPVTSPSATGGEINEEQRRKPPSRPPQVQFVFKGIKQSANKVNMVAKLVRGMRLEDAIMQLQVTDKQSAKTVYQALHSARADATYNHGLDPERLLVAGAFMGKGFLGFHKNKVYYHGKGNDGTKVRPAYQLTVLLREIAPEEEEEIAKQRTNNFLYITKRLRLTNKENKFVPLVRSHKGKASNSQPSGMAS